MVIRQTNQLHRFYRIKCSVMHLPTFGGYYGVIGQNMIAIFTRPIHEGRLYIHNGIWLYIHNGAVALVNYLFLIWRHLVDSTDKTVCIIGFGGWLTHASPHIRRIDYPPQRHYSSMKIWIIDNSRLTGVLHHGMSRSVVYNFKIVFIST